MQGQRTAAESISVEFEQGISSSNSPVASQLYWNNLVNQSDDNNNVDELSFSGDVDMPFANAAASRQPSFNSWNCSIPGHSGHPIGHTIDDESKMDHEWASAFTLNGDLPSRIYERRFESDGFLSLDNGNINTDSSQITSTRENDTPQNSVPVTESDNIDGCALETGISHSFIVPGSNREQTPSRITSASYFETSDSRYAPEDNGGVPGNSLDGRRLAGKRKNIERISGQSSMSGNLHYLQRIENIYQGSPVSHTQRSNLNMSDLSANTPASGEDLRSQYSTAVAGNAENSLRNFRMRINPHQFDSYQPNAWSSGNSMRQSNTWQPHQPSSPLILNNQSPEYRLAYTGLGSQVQPRIPVIPTLPRHAIPFPLNGPSSSRIGNRSHFPVLAAERSTSSTQEMNSWSIVRGSSEPSVFPPSLDQGQIPQDPTTSSRTSGSISTLQPAASTSQIGPTGVNLTSSPPTFQSRQNLHTQYSQRLSELIHRSFPSGSANNITQMQRPSLSTPPSDMLSNLGTRLRGQPQPRLTSAYLMGREDDGVLAMPSAQRISAAREERSRMLSEIRNALDSIRGGRSLRFEDILILDHSMFFGGADLHDRHRDMRLDVDNMSYEELLALEERIGNVSTGLSEEVVLKSLKQRKYSLVAEDTSTEVEPCCVCQEEYAEGVDVGTLNCGHDFHTACIKQWLAHKNICPICKKTALVT